MIDDSRYERRTVLRGVGTVATAGLLAGCGGDGGGGDGSGDGGDGTSSDDGEGGSSDGGGGDSDGSSGNGSDTGDGSGADSTERTPTATPTQQANPVETHLSDTSNFDGIADKTGTDSVTVAVGAEGNGAYFAFEPPAIRVTTGTTVTWEWTGQGTVHNVAAVEGADFKSKTTGEKGHTFTQTFEKPGTILYVCIPHQGTGMKGAIVVE